MEPASMESLPGGEIVAEGLRALRAGADSVDANAVLLSATRLRDAGIEVPEQVSAKRPSHRLYELLHEELGDGAHSRYNATLRRVLSFARAAEHARAG